jgi:GT2 family glycosyltransferase
MLIQSSTRGLAKATCFKLVDDIVLVIFDDQNATATPKPQIDGQPLPPPYARLTLPLSWGGARQTIAFRWTPAMGNRLELADRSDRTIAIGELDQLATFEPGALLADIERGTTTRLVRQFLEVYRDLFKLHDHAEFAKLSRQLLAETGASQGVLRAHVSVASRLKLGMADLPRNFGEITSIVHLSDHGVRPSPYKPMKVAKAGLLLMVNRQDAGHGDIVVLFGRNTAFQCRVDSSASLPFIGWLRGNRAIAAPARSYVTSCLLDTAQTDVKAQALLREIDLFDPPSKRDLTDRKLPVGGAVELCILEGIGGAFLKGWIRDPHRLIEEVRLVSAFGKPQPLDGIWHRFPRPDVDKHYDDQQRGGSGAFGFIAYLPAEGQALIQPKIELKLGSGTTVEILPQPTQGAAVKLRDAILGSLPPTAVTTDAIERCLAQPAAALHNAHLATRKAPDVIQLGTAPENPKWSVIVPLYRNLDYLRFQIGSFATDPDFRQVELIYVLDSPEQRGDLVHFLSGLNQLYDLPMTIVIMSANFGYAAANNAGAEVAHGEHLLLLNSDVVPEASGWLSALTAPLEVDSNVVATGARLLFDDQSLQHAGMHFIKDAGGHWLNLHYFKGTPREFAPALVTRHVPAVTGAALLVRRQAFLDVGGFTEDFIIGDYEDSDLCLKLRQAGGEIVYCPDSTLYHFERKSIGRHAGYQRSVAGLYNRWLAANKWDGAMTDIMQKFTSSPVISPRQIESVSRIDTRSARRDKHARKRA